MGLLPLYTQIGAWSIPTFRLTVGLAILASMVIGLRGQRPRGRAADAYLGALVLGVLGARLVHVALNWDYFAENVTEIGLLEAGGLDWHGAVWGGLLGLGLVVQLQTALQRRRGVMSPAAAMNGLLVALTAALPLIGLGGWVGCWSAGCAYGKEVDSLANYPGWMTSELVDVFGIVAPRYSTPYFGMAVCLLGLLLVAGLWRWKTPARFWLVLIWLSAGQVVIGLYRGDHVVYWLGLRGDQVLDGVMLVWAMVNLGRSIGRQDEQAAG